MNEDTLCSNIPTFAHSLGAAGYDTALIGRMHFNGMDQWHGFGKRLVGSLLPQYPYLKPPLSPDLWPGAEGRSRKGIDLAGPGKTAYQAYDEDVTEAAIQFLREQAKVTNKPFCAVVGFVRPHPPFVCSKTQWDYYHDRVSIPEVPSTYFQHLHPAIQRWRKMRGIEDITPEEFRRARAAYYGLVTELDIRIGRILGELEKQGLARNTVIVYTSDHGEMAGENGMWWKQNFYEGSVTVPLIMSFADRWVPAQRREVTSLIDVAPTILDMAQAMPLPEAIGSSLLPLLENGNVGWVNEAFSECRPELSVPAIRMIRSGRWKLVHFDGERPQLFDLQNDPHEFNDLAEDVGYAEVRKTLLDRVLSGWSAEDGRIGFERRMASSEMMSKWAVQVRPPLTAQWVAPPGANRFPEAP
jgi:choline-sulfatase